MDRSSENLHRREENKEMKLTKGQLRLLISENLKGLGSDNQNVLIGFNNALKPLFAKNKEQTSDVQDSIVFLMMMGSRLSKAEGAIKEIDKKVEALFKKLSKIEKLKS